MLRGMPRPCCDKARNAAVVGVVREALHRDRRLAAPAARHLLRRAVPVELQPRVLSRDTVHEEDVRHELAPLDGLVGYEPEPVDRRRRAVVHGRSRRRSRADRGARARESSSSPRRRVAKVPRSPRTGRGGETLTRLFGLSRARRPPTPTPSHSSAPPARWCARARGCGWVWSPHTCKSPRSPKVVRPQVPVLDEVHIYALAGLCRRLQKRWVSLPLLVANTAATATEHSSHADVVPEYGRDQRDRR